MRLPPVVITGYAAFYYCKIIGIFKYIPEWGSRDAENIRNKSVECPSVLLDNTFTARSRYLDVAYLPDC